MVQPQASHSGFEIDTETDSPLTFAWRVSCQGDGSERDAAMPTQTAENSKNASIHMYMYL